MPVRVEISHLSKSFGALQAVKDISFSVEQGEVLGFLGPNGAGKSTTKKMVTGFLPPTSGTAVVCGHDVLAHPIEVKKAIGYLPEGAPLYPDMTPLSLLKFVGESRGLPADRRNARIEEVVGMVGLEGVINQRIDTLSKGFKRRVGLACAILHDPDVLILDEPTDGLDPNQKHEVRRLIQRMSKGKVIVLSTHILEEVEEVCTRAIIISAGRLLFDGSPAELRARSRVHRAVVLHLAASASGVIEALTKLDGVREVEDLGEADGLQRVMIYPAGGKSIVHTVAECAQSSGWEVDHLHVERGNLEEVFREITLGELRPASPPKTTTDRTPEEVNA